MVKAGRKGSGINDLVWIGKAVTFASNFSSMGNRYIDKNDIKKGKYKSIIFSKCFYNNIKKQSDEDNERDTSDWFDEYESEDYGKIYNCNVVMDKMHQWINNGMED